MANALTIFQNGAAMPAHIAKFNAEHSNIAERDTTPTLNVTGKVWAISLNGKTTPLLKKNEEGEEIPVPIMRVVIIDYNKRRGRNYYQGTYDPKKITPPDCWSDDGLKPSPTIAKPMCASCGDCKLSAKGSKVSDNGKATVACSEFRLLAVVPAHNLDFTPLKLKLAITSDWDGQNEVQQNKGWYGFSNLLNLLREHEVKHTGLFVTKMKFDPAVAYPKILFSTADWLTEEQTEKIAELGASPDVADLLKSKWPTAATVVAPPVAEEEEDVEIAAPVQAKPKKPAVKPADQDDDEEVAVAPPVAPKKPKAAPAPVEDDEDEDDAAAKAAQIAAKAAAKAKAKAEQEAAAAKAAAAKAKAKAAPQAPSDDDDEDATPAAKPAKPAAKPGKPAVTEAPKDVSDLIADWDE